MKITMPRMFIEDCLSCDCDVGDPIKWGKRIVVLEMNDEQRAELHSRASYYTAEHGPNAEGLASLKVSAKACLRRLSENPQK